MSQCLRQRTHSRCNFVFLKRCERRIIRTESREELFKLERKRKGRSRHCWLEIDFCCELNGPRERKIKLARKTRLFFRFGESREVNVVSSQQWRRAPRQEPNFLLTSVDKIHWLFNFHQSEEIGGSLGSAPS